MGIILRLEEIRVRAAAIRLSTLALSALSGVSRHTIIRDNDTRGSSLEALSDALIAEEERLLRYLLEIYPGGASR